MEPFLLFYLFMGFVLFYWIRKDRQALIEHDIAHHCDCPEPHGLGPPEHLAIVAASTIMALLWPLVVLYVFIRIAERR